MSCIDDLVAELCRDGVQFESLRTVGTWYGGGTPAKSIREYWEDGTVPWLSPKDMDADEVTATEDHISEIAIMKSTVKLVPAGSVAFVVRSNVLRRRLPVALVPFEVTLNQDMRAVVPREGVLVEYLAQACRARAESILAQAGRTDGSMAAIQGRALLDFQVPIPPIEIQRELVRLLDRFKGSHLDLEAELEAELEARRRQYGYYRDSLLAFRDAGGVRWLPMGEVGTFTRGRRFVKDDIVDRGLPAIHYGEIYTHYGTSTDTALSNVRPEMASSLRFAQPGDVVIAAVGETVEDVGKAVAWLGDGPVAVHDDCFAFRHAQNPKFIAYCLQTTALNADKDKYVSRAKVKRLSAEGLGKLVIPVPPLDEQERIVAILDKLDALVNDLSIGLPAELTARRGQYEYYRDRLLTFEESTA
jgi:type I restriction enzyme S subunit